MTEVDVPAVGRVDKKWVYAGAAAAAAIVGYAWMRRLRAADTAPAIGPDDIGATGYAGTPGASSSAPIAVDDTDKTAIDTNDKWVRYATEQLSGLGWEPGPIPTALGKWLQRQPLSEREVDVVISARGVAGDPPVGGPYPVIHAQPTPTPGAPTPPGPAYATVQAGWKVNQWIRDLQAGYGPGATVREGLTYDNFVRLNPQMNGNIKWAGGDNENNTFKSAATYRIR